MEIVYQVLNDLDKGQIVAVGLMFWFFYSRINKRFDKVDDRFDKIEIRIEKLDEKITDIDRRVCRMEGALNNKECCLLKEDKHIKKAE